MRKSISAGLVAGVLAGSIALATQAGATEIDNGHYQTSVSHVAGTNTYRLTERNWNTVEYVVFKNGVETTQHGRFTSHTTLSVGTRPGTVVDVQLQDSKDVNFENGRSRTVEFVGQDAAGNVPFTIWTNGFGTKPTPGGLTWRS